MRQERHVFPVTHFLGHVAAGQVVMNERRRNQMRLADGRFQQGGLERQHGPAVGTGAFREQNHKRAAVESGFDLIGELARFRRLRPV